MAVSIADPPPTATYGVERALRAAERDRLLERRVGGLDVGPVEDHHLDPRGPDLVGDPVRVTGRRHPGVGDQQHPAGVVRREVVTDLVPSCPAPNFRAGAP